MPCHLPVNYDEAPTTMTSNTTLVEELQAVVGDAYVLHDHADLIVFEYDGSVDKALPSAVVLPASAEEVSEVVRIACLHDLPIVRAGRRYRPERRRGRRARRHPDAPYADDPDPGDRRREPHSGGRAGARQHRPDRRCLQVRPLLRARSLQPEGMHDRRQRGRELGRSALSRIRGYHQSRART